MPLVIATFAFPETYDSTATLTCDAVFITNTPVEVDEFAVMPEITATFTT